MRTHQHATHDNKKRPITTLDMNMQTERLPFFQKRTKLEVNFSKLLYPPLSFSKATAYFFPKRVTHLYKSVQKCFICGQKQKIVKSITTWRDFHSFMSNVFFKKKFVEKKKTVIHEKVNQEAVLGCVSCSFKGLRAKFLLSLVIRFFRSSKYDFNVSFGGSCPRRSL